MIAPKQLFEHGPRQCHTSGRKDTRETLKSGRGRRLGGQKRSDSQALVFQKKIFFKTLLPQFCAPFYSEEPTRPEAPQKLLFLPVVRRAMGSLQPDPRPSQPDPRVFSIETLFGSSKRAFLFVPPSCATVACKSKGGDTSARHSFYAKETRKHR